MILLRANSEVAPEEPQIPDGDTVLVGTFLLLAAIGYIFDSWKRGTA